MDETARNSPLLLVDGHNLLWIAAMGTPASIPNRDSSRDLTGVFMFFALLRKAIRDNLVDHPEVIVVFDGEMGSAERKCIDPAYKANRPAKPPVLLENLPDIKQGLETIGITWIELRQHEADDVIATLVAASGERPCYILSRDKDYYQLLNDRVHVLNTARPSGQRIITPVEVIHRFHVAPHQWCDRAALVGDPSDNVCGVRGVGHVTAARLLNGGLHLEDLPDSGRLTGRVGTAILQYWPQVLVWRDMMRMRDSISLPDAATGRTSSALPSAGQVIDALGLW